MVKLQLKKKLKLSSMKTKKLKVVMKKCHASLAQMIHNSQTLKAIIAKIGSTKSVQFLFLKNNYTIKNKGRLLLLPVHSHVESAKKIQKLVLQLRLLLHLPIPR